MGRHRWTNRLTVEDCPLCLCVASFHRAGVFDCSAGATGPLSWSNPSGEQLGRLEWRLDHSGPTGLAIYIRRQVIRFGVPVDEQTMPVATVRPHLGGKRFWFLCACGKRAGRLYLPPGQRMFRCRHCYNLTYGSTQTQDKRKYDMLRDPTALRAALRSDDLKQYLRGIGAVKLAARRMRSPGR